MPKNRTVALKSNSTFNCEVLSEGPAVKFEWVYHKTISSDVYHLNVSCNTKALKSQKLLKFILNNTMIYILVWFFKKCFLQATLWSLHGSNTKHNQPEFPTGKSFASTLACQVFQQYSQVLTVMYPSLFLRSWAVIIGPQSVKINLTISIKLSFLHHPFFIRIVIN